MENVTTFQQKIVKVRYQIQMNTQGSIDEDILEKKFNQGNLQSSIESRKAHYQRLNDIRDLLKNGSFPASYTEKPRHYRANLKRDAQKYRIRDEKLLYMKEVKHEEVVGKQGCETTHPLEWIEGVHFDRQKVCHNCEELQTKSMPIEETTGGERGNIESP